jgi:hypothetical protein
MLYLLRHIAVRLWISLLVGSLLVFTLFSLISARTGLETIFWGATVSFVVFYFIIGWVCDTLGMRWVNILIREAGIWERAGNYRQAEKIYRKAISLFDSFLISPFARREKLDELSARMARFYLASRKKDRMADRFISTYLEMHPEDEEVSEIWLQSSDNQKSLLKTHGELALKLGEAQPGNKDLQTLLARAYLLSERSDFPALKTYRRIIEDDAIDDRQLLAAIARRFFEDRLADRWALKAYLAVFKQDRTKTWPLKGIAACLDGQAVNGQRSPVFREAEALLSQIDADQLKMLREGFQPTMPATRKKEPKVRNTIEAAKTWALTALTGIKFFSNGLFKLSGLIRSVLAGIFQSIRARQLTQPILKWATVGIAGAVLVVLVINTASHLIQTRQTPGPAPSPPSETPPVITDPFTIQVAAYLKVEHAEKFVATLKNLNLDAYYTKAKSTKSTWYQVRISHFPTKEDARLYGESLKSKGIIDDFYVANYQRP